MPPARFLIALPPAAFAAFPVDSRADDPFPLGLTLKDYVLVTAKGKVTIKFEPLAAGRYPFRGEFHDATAQGVPVAE
jgi:hypothetical protein